MDAYQRGDYATAYQVWHPLADQGSADAQYYLGIMYDNGDGVLQDYAEALVDVELCLGVLYER